MASVLKVNEVQSDTDLPLVFNAGNAERVRIDTSGNVGIGTSSPTRLLTLSGSGVNTRVQINNTVSGKNFGLYAADDGSSVINYGSSAALLFTESGTERMRIDSSGNVGIGTSSPSSYGLLTLQKYSTSAPPYLVLNNRGANTTDGSTYTQGGILFTGYRDTNDPAYIASITVLRASQSGGASSAGDIVFGTTATPTGSIPTERARIDSSGNLLVGQTTAGSPNSNSFGTNSGGWINVNHVNGTGSGTGYAFFGYNGGSIGSITQNGTTAVAYNTSSDYRLKHDIAPMTGALAKVAALNPVTYKWNADDSAGEGFIAHELQEVCPDAVTGEKDAVNEDGSIKPQGIDTSFLVATLTAAIQEQQQMIETLQAKVAALENA